VATLQCTVAATIAAASGGTTIGTAGSPISTNTMYPWDLRSGPGTMIFPATPTDGDLIGFKIVAYTPSESITLTVKINSSSSAHFNVNVAMGISGPKSIEFAGQDRAALFIYGVAENTWTLVSHDLPSENWPDSGGTARGGLLQSVWGGLRWDIGAYLVNDPTVDQMATINRLATWIAGLGGGILSLPPWVIGVTTKYDPTIPPGVGVVLEGAVASTGVEDARRSSTVFLVIDAMLGEPVFALSSPFLGLRHITIDANGWAAKGVDITASYCELIGVRVVHPRAVGVHLEDGSGGSRLLGSCRIGADASATLSGATLNHTGNFVDAGPASVVRQDDRVVLVSRGSATNSSGVLYESAVYYAVPVGPGQFQLSRKEGSSPGSSWIATIGTDTLGGDGTADVLVGIGDIAVWVEDNDIRMDNLIADSGFVAALRTGPGSPSGTQAVGSADNPATSGGGGALYVMNPILNNAGLTTAMSNQNERVDSDSGTASPPHVSYAASSSTITDSTATLADRGKSVWGNGIPEGARVGVIMGGGAFSLVNPDGSPATTSAAGTSVQIGQNAACLLVDANETRIEGGLIGGSGSSRLVTIRGTALTIAGGTTLNTFHCNAVDAAVFYSNNPAQLSSGMPLPHGNLIANARVRGSNDFGTTPNAIFATDNISALSEPSARLAITGIRFNRNYLGVSPLACALDDYGSNIDESVSAAWPARLGSAVNAQRSIATSLAAYLTFVIDPFLFRAGDVYRVFQRVLASVSSAGAGGTASVLTFHLTGTYDPGTGPVTFADATLVTPTIPPSSSLTATIYGDVSAEDGPRGAASGNAGMAGTGVLVSGGTTTEVPLVATYVSYSPPTSAANTKLPVTLTLAVASTASSAGSIKISAAQIRREGV
jgi:hypothetical protein